ncbi:MAG: hypothetical protein LIP77_10285 [Planctomycetes bacterium]|nr:hypothetical protein [Planctomycetota bacterium]
MTIDFDCMVVVPAVLFPQIEGNAASIVEKSAEKPAGKTGVVPGWNPQTQPGPMPHLVFRSDRLLPGADRPIGTGAAFFAFPSPLNANNDRFGIVPALVTERTVAV